MYVCMGERKKMSGVRFWEDAAAFIDTRIDSTLGAVFRTYTY